MDNIRKGLLLDNFQEYIQDGLVFELDGTDKKSHGDICWTDKVGGMTFTNMGEVEELCNGFRFDGTAESYLSGNDTLKNVTYNNCTIEVVILPKVDYGVWNPVVMFSDWDDAQTNQVGIVIWYNASSNYEHSMSFNTKAKNGSTCAYVIPRNTLITAAVKSNQPIVINHSTYSQISNTSCSSGSNRDAAYIGARVDGHLNNTVLFKGDIYAIRVYNRLLTEDEINHNQTIDIAKYNIQL